jgi:hypothetical protein
LTGLATPLIVTATFAPADFARLDGLRRAHFPPERNQVPAHLTLFHHLPPAIELELGRRLAAAAAGPPPCARMVGIMDLGRGTAFRVESDALAGIRAELARAFHGLLTPQDQAPWRPHVTIQNKVERRAATDLQQQLRLEALPRPLAIAGLASWRYLGGPWEKLREHPFRG